jgi:hypothetical protein
MRRRRTTHTCTSARRGRPRVGTASLLIAFAALLMAAGLGAPDDARAHMPAAATKGDAVPPPVTKRDRAPARPRNAWMSIAGDPIAMVLKDVRRFAACVRRRGIPVSKPKIVGDTVFLMLPRWVDRSAPSLKEAQRLCQKASVPPGGSVSQGGRA